MLSYIDNRKFYVSHDNVSSELIKAEVPQSCALSPTLFLLYTADFHQCYDTNMSLFADDTCFITWHPYYCKHISTSYRDGSKHRIKCQIYAKINNEQIFVQENVKYLGIYLDKHLTWKEHIKRKENNWICFVQNITGS